MFQFPLIQFPGGPSSGCSRRESHGRKGTGGRGHSEAPATGHPPRAKAAARRGAGAPKAE